MAQQSTPTFTQFSTGSTGSNADNSLFGSATSSTQGGDGGSISPANTISLTGSTNVNTPTVNITVNGGPGGNGYYSLVGSDLKPSNGGAGGRFTFTNGGTITAINLYPGTPVVQLLAQGGVGGYMASGYPGGNGGNGGTIGYINAAGSNLPGSITFAAPMPTGPVFDYGTMPTALLNADASGGASGYTGSYQFPLVALRATRAYGGSGGTVAIDITGGAMSLSRPAPGTWTDASGNLTAQTTVGSATGMPAYMISAIANGGVGTSGGGSLPAPGGIGGAGGRVIVGVNGPNASVTGSGDAVVAVFASANGGNGGAGYGDSTGDYSSTGGDGGAAGTVTVRLGGGTQVSTTGSSAPALIALALGGIGAGSAGTQKTAIPFVSYSPGDNVGYGGFGGSAARPDGSVSVQINTAGQITTTGATSPGVIALALGGPGGNSAASGYTALAGGNGGAGGGISVVNTGTIRTGGMLSSGIIAISAGGTGGNGSNSGLFSGGGNGGQGAPGANVTVSNFAGGDIHTTGNNAIGMLAESLGGGSSQNFFGAAQFASQIQTPGSQGSGNGGTSGFLFWSRGGEGGAGGSGGNVTVTNAGTVATDGSNAPAILLQSVGGSGGTGGSAKVYGGFLAVAVGGSGGSGADAGAVTLNGGDSPGVITTTGLASPGIFAQSVGGNGGVGGDAATTSVGLVATVSVSVGGDGGGGGNGGPVTVTNNSTITTAKDSAPGVIAQSIGGGGGLAGQASSVGVAIGTGDVPAIAVTVSVGGSGGIAGNGGMVSVDSSQAVTTTGSQSPGIKVISIGGGGGDGGNASNTSNVIGFLPSAAITVGVGGRGGAAGNGGAVSVINSGAITTSGKYSNGIMAGSVGGGGGNGATDTSSAAGGLPVVLGTLGNLIAKLAIPQAKSATLNIGVGGDGGASGAGGQVNVRNDAAIQTTDAQANGILAQSIGGGGGNAGGYNGNGSGALAATVNIGGKGNAGGNGGSVTVANSGGATIHTEGGTAHGIYAQSLGGGGGAGGSFTSDTNQSASTTKQLLTEGLKTFGYLLPDDVKDALSDSAKTRAKNAGKALTKATVAIVKSAWNAAKNIFKTNNPTDDAAAAASEIATSVVDAASGTSSFKSLVASLLQQRKDLQKAIKDQTKLPQFTAGLSVGGNGGAAGDGGAVSVQNDGGVTTIGDKSYGIFAQSVGGGGGAGGTAVSSGQNLVQATVSIGGGGGGGGTGGQVDVNTTGSIATSGEAAYGILAQSVGGGGGIGGIAQNQQTAGGHIAVNLGGSSSQFSPGGAVTVNVTGSLSTAGHEAHGLLAQSIGGGGGLITIQQNGPPKASDPSALEEAENLVVDMLTTAAGIDPTSLSGVADASYLPAPTIGLTLGGTGGGGGDGGNVTVNLSGSIQTTGDNAFGILAQSIGGGGGTGASTRAGGVLQLDQTFGFGGSGGAGGKGGNVTLNFGGTASIHTSGIGSNAVVLQSIGGGGGYSGSFEQALWRTSGSTGPSFPTVQGTAGNGGSINVAMTDPAARLTISTTGENAHGIFAQSIGGGGGLAADGKGLIVPDPKAATASRVNLTGSIGGSISVNTAGAITTTGHGAIGIYAQSGFMRANGSVDPNFLSANIAITHQGDIQGGSGSGGAAIRIDGGNQNTISLLGGSVRASSGTAVVGTFGNEALNNGGVLTGDVLLDGGRTGEFNQIQNLVGATFVTGSQIALGPLGLMINAGTMALGPPNTYETVNLGGNFTQSGSGTLIVHADFKAARSNTLAVSGQVDLSGTVRVDLANPAPSPGLTIVTAGQNLALNATASTGLVVYTYDLKQPDNQTVRLNLNADFRPASASLNGNQQQIAAHLQGEWDAGIYDRKYSSFTKVLSLGAYYRALNQLSPEGSSVPAANKAQTSQTFMNNMMSCPDFVGSDTELVERDCTWLRTIGGWINQNAAGESAGYKLSGVTYQVGGQKNLGAGWILGASAAYGTTLSRGNGGLSSSAGQSVDVGAALKYQTGNWLFAGSLAGGYAWYDNRRQINFDNSGLVAQSAGRVESVSLRLRATRQFPMGPVYIRPYADLDTVYTRAPEYRETNADLYNLRVMSADQVTVLGSPMIEFGSRINPGGGLALRLFAALGATIRSNDGFQTTARFLAQPTQVSPFVTTTHVPKVYGNLIAGLDVLHVGGLEIKGQYAGKIATGYFAQEATLRVGYKF